MKRDLSLVTSSLPPLIDCLVVKYPSLCSFHSLANSISVFIYLNDSYIYTIISFGKLIRHPYQL